MSRKSPFDLAEPAPNGLMRGFTTGAAAAAATKAAAMMLDQGVLFESVDIDLPDEEHYLQIPILSAKKLDASTAIAQVKKNAGDDPDQTHGAIIWSRVKVEPNSSEIRFLAGEGVGTVTKPGLQLGIGEPAINPVPREMIRLAVSGMFYCGLSIEIGCENGGEIAKRTFNPRIGVKGGISILGTTGIVEPKSLASWMASVEIYIKVALGDRPEQIVLTPGNLGQRFAREQLDLPVHQVVQMSNFVGFSLDVVESTLRERDHTLETLWIVGHPGKLAKLLDGHWDTHSKTSPSPMATLEEIGSEFGIQSAGSELVEHWAQQTKHEKGYWNAVSERIQCLVSPKLERVEQVEMKLFAMDGTLLGRP